MLVWRLTGLCLRKPEKRSEILQVIQLVYLSTHGIGGISRKYPNTRHAANLQRTQDRCLLYHHLQPPVLFNSAGAGFGRSLGAIAIHTAIEPLESRGAERHHDSAEDKKPNSALKRNLLEDGIRVP